MILQALLGLITFLCYLAFRYQANRMFYRHLFEMESVFQEDLTFVTLTKGIIGVLLPRVGANGGVLFWQDNVHSEMKIRTVKGIPAEMIHPTLRFLKEPKGLIEQAVQEEHGIYHMIPTPLPPGLPAKTWYVMPLRSRGKIYGILVLIKRSGGFSRSQQKLIVQFGKRCGIHMENALNHEMAVDSARENARLYLNLSRLYQQATRDELTGLYNRAFTLQRLREEAKKSWRFGHDLSLIFMDLDYFKAVNDNYGHAAGDRVLAEVAKCVMEQIRDYDVACRFGGEEFVLILPQTGPEGARELAVRIRRVISELKIGPEELTITASLGVASIMPGNGLAIADFDQGESWFQLCLEELVSRADAAMYVAKEKGRNRVEIGPPLDPLTMQSICASL